MNFKKILKGNKKALINSKKDFKAIFEIMFSHPDCILCEEGNKKHTYGEAYDMILSAADSLKKQIGIKGEFVALECENSLNWIVGFWAILISGNKPYLVNTRYPANLTNSIIKSLNIKYSLCVGESKLSATPIDILALKSDKTCSLDDMADEIAFSSSATSMNEVVCFYSGSQVAEQILNFEAIVKECPQIIRHYKGELKLLAFLPFYHIFGLFAVYFWFCFFGRTLVFLTDYSADTILKTCRDHNVTHIFAVPMLWHKIEQKVLSAIKEKGTETTFGIMAGLFTALQNIAPTFSGVTKMAFGKINRHLFGQSVQFCISGGSYLRVGAARLINSLGYSLHNGYGASEIGITSVDLRLKPRHLNSVSIGKPFDSVEYKIDDNGVLWVKGTSLCTKKMINGKTIQVDGWFNTDDNLTEIDGYYFICGRQSDIVIGDNGENINPDRIEEHFNVEGAKAISVLGLQSEKGEVLSLIVQIENDCDLSQIKNQLLRQNALLPNVTAVKKFYFTNDSLADSGDIKTSRKQIAKKIKSGQITLTNFDRI